MREPADSTATESEAAKERDEKVLSQTLPSVERSAITESAISSPNTRINGRARGQHG
jgi:hypothetical protein